MRPEPTKPGRLLDVWREKGGRSGCFSMFKAWKRRRTSPSAPTASVSCSVNAAKEPGAQRAIAGWSGSLLGRTNPCGTPVASEGVRHCQCWSTRLHACAKAKGLTCAGSRSPRPCRYPLPRDQIPKVGRMCHFWLINHMKTQTRHILIDTLS